VNWMRTHEVNVLLGCNLIRFFYEGEEVIIPLKTGTNPDEDQCPSSTDQSQPNSDKDSDKDSDEDSNSIN
ncbi:hypothetical protein BGZ76_006076, partial [Entomortierella beljakovae]